MSAFTELTDLAAARLGGAVLAASDAFFAEPDRLLLASPPRVDPDRYSERGRWMDGWETRRRRGPGHDWCLVRLGLPGLVQGIVIDTTHFAGSSPEHASVDACSAPMDASVAELTAPSTIWKTILRKSALKADAENRFAIRTPNRFTHARLNIHPDGGVARFRVHGQVVPDRPAEGRAAEPADLAAVDNGGLVLGASDMFFGDRANLILPGPGGNAGDGWVTRRRRGPGNDWAILRLGTEGTLKRVVVDTTGFTGNAPARCSVEGLAAEAATLEDLVAGEYSWIPILAETPLEPGTTQTFEDGVQDIGPVTHVRFNIFPDGGVMRLRLFGVRTRRGLRNQSLRWLNTVPAEQAEAAFRACCGYGPWASKLVKGRPYADIEGLRTAAEEAFRRFGTADWKGALARAPEAGTGVFSPWSGSELSGAIEASGETRATLATLSETYFDRFGFEYVVDAAGRSGREIVEDLETRLGRAPDDEIGTAARELRKITARRLERLLG